MADKVQYHARITEHEKVQIGSVQNQSGDRCARLHRFGKPVVTFTISPYQIRALRKGKTIRITQGAIDSARLFGHCTLEDGGLRGPRRR